MEAQLRPLFEQAVQEKRVPGIGAVVLDSQGNVLFKETFGSTNISDPEAPPFTPTTNILLFSCTKLVTCVGALQLLEQGRIQLDDPVEKYVPEIREIQVLSKFEEDGTPVLREPQTKPTVLHLITHTAGFSYDMFDGLNLQWRVHTEQNPFAYLSEGAMTNFTSPLVADPGTRHVYGVSIDWLGFIVEAVSGLLLPEYVEQNILNPLGMHSSGSHLKAGATSSVVHYRAEDGGLVGNPALPLADAPEKFGGGHYLCSTLEDYSNFLVTLLNNGTHPQTGAQILKEATVRDYLFKDYVPAECDRRGIGVIKSVSPVASNEGEFIPTSKSRGWSCGLMLNLEDLPHGRSAGSGAWAGMANLFYFIDPKAGRLGMVVSQVMPFMDREILHLFDQLERAVYGHKPATEPGEEGSNFRLYS